MRGRSARNDGYERIGGVGATLGRLGLLGVAIVACAGMLAAVGLPAVLTTGGLAREGAALVEELPDLVEPPLPQRSVLLAADGSPMATIYTQNRVEVPLERVPQVLIDAIVAVEDSRFFDHPGLDVRGIVRAVRENFAGAGGTQGGSTLTQQYVKNVLALSADDPEAAAEATERTLRRKLIEAHYALEVESRYTKDEILERYLNIAYLGGGAWGVQAAAQTYFGVDVDQLSLPQAATLAGQLQSPARTDPFHNPTAALERRNMVLRRMVTAGVLEDSDAAAAVAADLGVVGRPAPNGCAHSPYPFFCDWVVEELRHGPLLGDTDTERSEALTRGGLTVTTTLDPREQAAAQAAVDRLGHDHRVAVATTVVEPGTGAVTAMAVNRTYGTAEGQTVFPIPSTASHPGGSTFKVFALVAALEAGIRTDHVLPGGARHTSEMFDNPDRGHFTNSDSAGASPITLAQATISSQNTGYVQLSELVGIPTLADAARRLGVTSIPASGEGSPHAKEGSFALGARSVSTVEMANVAATLAAGGVRCDTGAVAKVAVAGTERVADRGCARTVDPSVAATAAALLGEVTESGTGRAAHLGRPTAGKTGTSQNFGSAWFVGFTPQRGAAVMLGDPRGVSHPLIDVAGVPRVYGGGLPAEVFAAALGPIHEPWPPLPLPVPDPAHLAATRPAVAPDVVGMSEAAARRVLTDAGRAVEVEPVEGPEPLQPGAVLWVRHDGPTSTIGVVRR